MALIHSTRFSGAISRGFDAAREPQVAVCLLPGTELAFAREVEYERYFTFWTRQRTVEKVAQFMRVNDFKPQTITTPSNFRMGKFCL
jgi:hypothetical protein